MILTPVLQNIGCWGGEQFSVRSQFSGYTRIHVLQVVSGRFIFQVMFSLGFDGRLALRNPGFRSWFQFIVSDPGFRS